MSVGDNYENPVLDAMLGSGHTSAFPDTVYLAVYREDAPPTDAGGGTELTDLGRIAMPNDDDNWPPASGATKENGLRVAFDPATVEQPAAGWWALHGDAAADDVVVWGRMGDVLTVYVDDALVFEAGSIVIPCD